MMGWTHLLASLACLAPLNTVTNTSPLGTSTSPNFAIVMSENFFGPNPISETDLDRVYRDIMSSVTSLTGAAIAQICDQIRAAVGQYSAAFDAYYTYKQIRILTECSDHGLPIDPTVQ